jgi:hypothetical protein
MERGEKTMTDHKNSRYLISHIFPLPITVIATIAVCILLPAPLSGQARRQNSSITTGQQQNQNSQNIRQRRGGSMGFDNLPVILNVIQDNPPASLVILDIREAGWESQAAGLLQQDPLVVLNLNILGLDAASGAGLELIQREGWTAGIPRWCLISTDGRVLYSSELTPSSDLIMAAFTSAGLRTRLDVLRQFLLMYPEHAEARLALLGELRAVAEARTRTTLGVLGVGTAVNPIDANTPPPPPPELDMGVDGDIWGEYAREADNAFQAELWKQDTSQLWGRTSSRGPGGMGLMRWGRFVGLFRGGGTSLVSNYAQYSPMMKTMYRRWLPNIEYNLSRYSSSFSLWNFWLVVQRVVGGRDLGMFQTSILPVPGDRQQDIPPPFVRSQWLQDCINRGDWRMAEDVARGAWENFLSQTTEQRGTDRPGQRPIGGGRAPRGFDVNTMDVRAWNSVVEPYIDVLLRQRKTSAADAVVQQWFSQGGWTGAARLASFLAKRLDLEDLGNKWEAMAPSGESRR